MEEEQESLFDDSKKDDFINEEKFDEYIEKMNAFVDKFDEDQGKENKVTFKAVASNLEWNKLDDVKAFAEHCKKQEIEGAEQVLAFLYYQYNENSEKFDEILEKMH